MIGVAARVRGAFVGLTRGTRKRLPDTFVLVHHLLDTLYSRFLLLALL